MEETLEREKKGRGDLDKVRRKVEGELKLTQEAIEELDRVKRGLEDSLKKYVVLALI